MEAMEILLVLLGLMFLLLGSGVWIGLSLMMVAAVGIDVFAGRPAGASIATTVWSSSSSWMLTALPMYHIFAFTVNLLAPGSRKTCSRDCRR